MEFFKKIKNKIRSQVSNIKNPQLKNFVFNILRRPNEWRVIILDIIAQFRDVKLYRTGNVDYNKQWEARVEAKSNNKEYGEYTDNSCDPESLDEDLIRKDDLFILKYLPEGSCVLELGCGNGRLGNILTKKKGIKYVGLEYSNIAVAKAKSKGLEVYQCDLNNLNDSAFGRIKNYHFDYVISIWVLDLLRNQEELISKISEYADVQLHGFWNAGHWSSRLRLFFGRFPIYNFSGDSQGRLIYPYIYGVTNRSWTLKDFKSYAKELGYTAELIGVGPKFGVATASLFKKMFWPSLRGGRYVFKIFKLL